MFRPVTMRQMSALVLEWDERSVLQELGQLGVVHLTRACAGPDTGLRIPRDRSKELARCDSLLARVQELRQSLELSPLSEALKPSETALLRVDERLGAMSQQINKLHKRRQLLTQRWDELAAVCNKVTDFRGLDIPLDQPDSFSFLHFVVGSLSAENLSPLEQVVGDKVALLPLPEQNGRHPVIAMTTRPRRLILERALQHVGFQPESFPIVANATVDGLTAASRREQEEIVAELEQLDTQLKALGSQFEPPLAEIEIGTKIERSLLEAEQKFLRTERSVLLSGWVPTDAVGVLEEHVRRITGGRCIFQIAVPRDHRDDQIPALLRHPGWLRPFERFVKAYGLPQYQELEPTLFVALSYVLMFGMMFGDAGHGAVLAVGGCIALIWGRTEWMRDAGLLILFAALSSIVFGIVYGSYFGLASLKHYALWHDPLEGDPIHLMYGAIGIGIGMISLGLVLNIINRFRNGDVIGGFLDKFGVMGMLFYWGGLALITKHAEIEAQGLLKVAGAFFLGLPLLGWSVKEPLEHIAQRHRRHPSALQGSLSAAIAESLVGAFEAVLSYLANTISFVRLAAYAMSHAALLVAVFMMAKQVESLSVVGGVLSVLIILLGNLFAIILEGIIASVQALRLEYYEFFGKFFSGSGQPFTPFRLPRYEPAAA